MFRDRDEDGKEAVAGTPAVAAADLKPGDLTDIKGAAAYLNVSEMRVRTLLREGRLEGATKVPVGETQVVKWQVPVSALDTYRETKGTFGEGRKGGKAWVVRIKEPAQLELLQKFCSDNGLDEPTPRYKYDPEKAKAYRLKKAAEKKAEAAAAG